MTHTNKKIYKNVTYDALNANAKYYDSKKSILTIPVTISKHGEADYLSWEIFNDNKEDVITVVKNAKTFTEDTVKSFENTPLVKNHPTEYNNDNDVVVWDNDKHDIYGVVRDVRIDGEYLKANVVVTDKKRIDDILNNNYQVSAGYDYQLLGTEDGKYVMENMIGHHVALVRYGRMGSECRIGDKDITINKLTQQLGDDDMSKNQEKQVNEVENLVADTTVSTAVGNDTLKTENEQLKKQIDELNKKLINSHLVAENEKLKADLTAKDAVNAELYSKLALAEVKVKYPSFVVADNDTLADVKVKLVAEKTGMTAEVLKTIGDEALDKLFDETLKNAEVNNTNKTNVGDSMTASIKQPQILPVVGKDNSTFNKVIHDNGAYYAKPRGVVLDNKNKEDL